MTDAERIAEYLKKVELDDGPLEDIERMYRYRGEVLPSSRYGVTMALRDMLSDVRREEREACATEVRRELVEAERQGERMAAKRLGWALKHIRVRGDQ